MLTAGWATAPLTGGLGIPLASRLPVAALAEDVLDEPRARALVLDDEVLQVAFVAVDLFAIDADLVQRAAELVYDQIRIFSPAILVVPTATQTAPLAATLLGLPPRPEVYCQHVAEQIAAAVVYAARSRVPAAVGWATGPGPAVARFDDLETGQPLALLGELPSLPAATGGAVSADYPGAMASFFSRAAPRLGWIGLLGSAAGVRPDDDLALYGESLGALTYATALRAETGAVDQLGIAARTVKLGYQAPEVDAAEERLEEAELALERAVDAARQRVAVAEVERARQAVAAAQPGWLGEREVRVTAVALGDGAVVGVSLLPSKAAGAAVRAAVPTGARTLVCGGVNGLFGVLSHPGDALEELTGWHAALPFEAAAIDKVSAAAAQAVQAASAMAAADRSDSEPSEAAGDDSVRA